MGFVSMRRNFGRHMRTLLYIIFGVFLVSCFYYFGAYNVGPGRREGTQRAEAVLATVNGEKIPRSELEARFQEAYERWDQFGMASLANLEGLRWQVLNDLIQQRLLVEAAQAQGLAVSKREVKKELDRQVKQALGELRGVRARSAEYRRTLERAIRARADEVRDAMLIQRLQDFVGSRVKATEQQVRDSYRQIRARHILVAVDPAGKAGLSDADAKKKAEQLLARLRAGADFAALARQSSDDKTTAAQGGDLGWFGRGRMSAEFERAAFALKPGETSGVVKTPYGYHIIRVEGQRDNLPADFEKKKDEYRKQYLEQQRSRAWQEFVQGLRARARIEIRDPEMRAAKAQLEGRVGEAIENFTRAAEYARQLGEQVHAAIYFSLGELYAAKGDLKRAVEAYQKAQDIAMSSLSDIYLALGDTYRRLGNKPKALEYYQAAEDEAPQDYGVRQRLLEAYQALGEKEAAARQSAWIEEQQRQWAQEQARQMEQAARDAARAAQSKAPRGETGKAPTNKPGGPRQ